MPNGIGGYGKGLAGEIVGCDEGSNLRVAKRGEGGWQAENIRETTGRRGKEDEAGQTRGGKGLTVTTGVRGLHAADRGVKWREGWQRAERDGDAGADRIKSGRQGNDADEAQERSEKQSRATVTSRRLVKQERKLEGLLIDQQNLIACRANWGKEAGIGAEARRRDDERRLAEHTGSGADREVDDTGVGRGQPRGSSNLIKEAGFLFPELDDKNRLTGTERLT
ncbi:hypothetical protein FIBSPDRAFT_902615 [Athelia psychrophila]|uniref:Uncharacterized protein n=1 Tax=Athelia psychrophila TaxID=1759441 RepID=A0A167X016_9AGAM|nr:hypothetical protein FIBSPDRAFT_902615 [Fibularhizoctonia sp. CBS 109695]